MAETNVRVVARFKAKPDRVEDVKRILSGMVGPTREEEGCVLYQLLQNKQAPADFTFVEEWTNEAALEVHSRAAHIRSGRAQLEGLLAADAEVAVYEVVA